MSSSAPAYTNEDVTARAEHLIRITYQGHQTGGSLPSRVWTALIAAGGVVGLLVTLPGALSADATFPSGEWWGWVLMGYGAGFGAFFGTLLGWVAYDVIYSHLRARVLALTAVAPESVHRAFLNVREADARRVMERRRH